MQDVWFVLEDGRTVDPSECAPANDAGELVHSSGVPVAYRAPGVPRSRGVDAAVERAGSDGQQNADDVAAKAAADEAAKAAADAKPGKGKGKGKDMNSPADREMRGDGASDYETR